MSGFVLRHMFDGDAAAVISCARAPENQEG